MLDRTGEVAQQRSGPAKDGREQADDNRPGPDETGQHDAGPDRIATYGAAQDGVAQEGADQEGADQNRAEPSGAARTGPGQGGAGQAPAKALAAFLEEPDPRVALRKWLGGPLPAGDGAERRQALRALIDRDIAALDALAGEQIDAILHHPQFKRLEAAWRGVGYLLDQAEDDEKVVVRLFGATWAELGRDFSRASEFDQSALFAKVYSEEYGMPGGLPYGLLLCDHPVRHHHRAGAAQEAPGDDIGTLSGIAEVAAAAFSPCVVGAAPELFGVTTFAEMSHMQSPDAGFRLGEYQRWRRLRRKEESRFLGVALPRILLRGLHRGRPAGGAGFVYRERALDIEDWLWGNGAYGFGAVVIRAFRESGWFADIRGAPEGASGGGLLEGLPAPRFSTGEAVAYRRPLEVELTDRKQKLLEELGFVALSPCSYTQSVVLLGAQSLKAPSVADTANTAESRNERLSSMLQYILCVSRFAHYIKVMARDRMGAYTTAAELQRMLNEWLRGYMIGNADAGAELKARYPLSGGGVQISEVPGRPGALTCVIRIQPHFQFDQIVSDMQLRTEIQATRAI